MDGSVASGLPDEFWYKLGFYLSNFRQPRVAEEVGCEGGRVPLDVFSRSPFEMPWSKWGYPAVRLRRVSPLKKKRRQPFFWSRRLPRESETFMSSGGVGGCAFDHVPLQSGQV